MSTSSAIPVVRPTLLVVAMQYDVVTPEVEQVLADRLGDQLTIERLDCGHLVYWERFDDTVAVVRNFLG